MTDMQSTKLVTARKPHRCSQCGITIPAGLRCYRSRGLYDGAFYSDATCVDCQHLAADLYQSGYFSEGAYGEECYPYLPEADYWPEVRAISVDWSERVDAYLTRAGRKS